MLQYGRKEMPSLHQARIELNLDENDLVQTQGFMLKHRILKGLNRELILGIMIVCN